MKKTYLLVIIIGFIISFFSCSSKKKIVLLQDSDQFNNATVPYNQPTIQRNDILSVQFSVLDPELAAPYNKVILNQGQGGQMNQNFLMQGYLVSDDYNITLPVIGNVNVKGKTTNELAEFLKQKMINENRLTNPTVNVVILNGKFTILGQVGSEGVYHYQEHNLNIFQALGMAGIDLQGKIYNIKLIREVDGVQNVGNIDLRSNNVINSPYYYIRQNDIIYVEPTGPVVTSQGFITNYNAIISIGSLILTTVLLLTR